MFSANNKKSKIIGISITAVLIGLMTIGQSFAQSQKSKKLICLGWGTRNTMYVRDHWQEMEKMPLNGAVISVAIDRSKPTNGDGSTLNTLGWHLFGPKAFGPEVFKPALDDLKTPKWSKFDSNFLMACICSQGQDAGFDWFDDKRWKIVLNNWTQYAKLAKESGCKGVIMDNEHYGIYWFCYKEMNSRRNASFDEYNRKVRQRGRELMQATAKVFPDMEMPIFFTQSYTLYLQKHNKSGSLATNDYGLLPAFIDGMLEGADKRTKFIDFYELAYGFTQRQQYLDSYHIAYNKALEYTTVPDLYRARVTCGFPLWIDCPYDNKTWDPADFSKNFFTPESLKTTLATALDVSDEYVWIYYEHNISFFPAGNLPDPYINAIREAHPSAK